MSERFPGGFITKTPVVPSGPYETSSASGIWTLDQQQQAQKAGIWPTAGNVQPDPYFEYVTMLLHGDGTNGGQNNTFLDSSTNNFTVTRNGNTTQGSFSPYGLTFSNYFDGTGDYLKYPDGQTNLELGTGDFTVECWAYSQQTSNNYGRVFWFQYNGSNSGSGLAVEAYNDAGTQYTLNYSGGQIQGSSYTSPTKWVHVAVTRASGTIRFFVNGTLIGSASDSGNYTSATGPIVGGAYYNSSIGNELYYGYISNFRMVKGTALYTSAFTPSTTPLTAVSGTQMLTCQSYYFLDVSSNSWNPSVNGNPSVQRFNPFGTTSAYSTGTNGGSAYFDGNGDYLSIPSDSAFDMGSGNFTIEGWFYVAATAAVPQIITYRSGSGSGAWYIGIDGTRLEVFVGTTTVYSNAGVIKVGAWYHFALERNGSNLEFYFNGARRSQVSAVTMPASTGPVLVGYQSSNYYWNGFIADLRIVKGIAVYTTSPYTTPTAPLTAISGTSLLLGTTNGAIFDNAMMNDLETVGNAQISTSVVKYGTGSLAFDGSGDWLQAPIIQSNALGAGDFTVEMWVYMNNTTGTQVFYADGTDGSGPGLYSDAGTLKWYDGTVLTSGGTLSAGAWTHIAACRASGTLRFFINGTQTPTAHLTSNNYIAKIVRIGSSYYNEYLNGYIDDLRITKGYARYTANFTPPTAAFPNF